MSGIVIYDWEPNLIEIEQLATPHHLYTRFDHHPAVGPCGPGWLREIVGDEFFQKVDIVLSTPRSIYEYNIPEADILAWIPHLQSLQGLEKFIIQGTISDGALKKIKLALPMCQIIQEHGFVDSAH